MQDLIFSQIPLEQLKSELLDPIKKELHSYFSTLEQPKAQTEYLTRKEAAELLSISLPTLNEWTKQGVIQGLRIASRVRYKKSDVEKALTQIRTTSKQ